MSAAPFYKSGGFEVTRRLLRTPRRTYALANVEFVSVTRPLLFALGAPSIGLALVALSLRAYLTSEEIAVLAAGVCVSAFVASYFGTLRVYSLALRGDDDTQTFGAIWRLREVRSAVERAIIQRNDNEATS